MARGLHAWTTYAVISFLKKHDFVHHRTNGSHFQYKKIVDGTGRLVTVASHGSKNIPIGTMNSIVRQSGIPKNEWLEDQK